MAGDTSIEWTSATWNPVTGCTKISQGCKNCYAERMAKRLHAMGSERYQNIFDVTLHEDLIARPRSWAKPRMIFVNSMSDLFHESVPLEFIAQIFDTMQACPQHVFQILTKRSQRLADLAPDLTWSPNIWIGVSVENQSVIERIYHLQSVPAKIRFLSCEPLLGPLDNLPLNNVEWVIVGGESGPGARPMKRDWVLSILEQCRSHKIPFFFKQWGGTKKVKTGRTLLGVEYNEFPIDSPPDVLPTF